MTKNSVYFFPVFTGIKTNMLSVNIRQIFKYCILIKAYSYTTSVVSSTLNKGTKRI